MMEAPRSHSQLRDRVWKKISLTDSNDQNITGYNKWAETYESDVVEGLEYRGYQIVAKYMDIYCKYLGIKRDAKIIDIGSGPGLVGKLLASTFTNLDALDAAQAMLREAEKLGIYQNLIRAKLGNSETLPIETDCYDAAVICAAVLPGHLDESCLPEIIRIVKPGGLVLNVTRKVYVCKEEGRECLINFIPACDRWQREGKWKTVDVIIPHEIKYAENEDAIVLVHQVL